MLGREQLEEQLRQAALLLGQRGELAALLGRPGLGRTGRQQLASALVQVLLQQSKRFKMPM